MAEQNLPDDATTSRGVLLVLYRLAKAHKRQFIIIAIFALLATGADLMQPLIYRHAINSVAGLFVEKGGGTSALTSPNVQPQTPEETFQTLLIAVGLLFVASTVGYYFSQKSDYLSSVAASRMESDLIVNTFGHVLRLPLQFFARRPSAGLAKRIDQSDQVSPIVHAFSQQIAPEIVRLFGICGIMLSQNVEMTAVSMSLLPPYLWISRRSALRLKTGLDPYYEMWENISARIYDGLAAIKTVKLSGAERREETRLRDDSRVAYDVYLNRIRTAQRYYLSQSFLSNLSKALVLGYGGWLVLRKQLTPGDVVMFAAYLDRLYAPVDSLNGMAVNLQQYIAALRRAVILLDKGPVEEDGADLPPGPGRVEFRDVHFSYVEGIEVLRGLSFTIEPGKITAIAGPSGAGKTTAADLLLKLFTPSSGEILIDGQRLSEIGPAAVRRVTGVVSTDGAVFRGTIADNVRYKRLDATDGEVHEAALAAGLGRVLNTLPDGLASEIGDRGIGLSMGERQRVQIARILASRPRLLVLDEATANLDFETENEVRMALDRLSPRPTMLVIAHRYNMIRQADHVIVIEAGRVLEQGSPAELMASGGWFAALARSGSTEPLEAEPPEEN